MQFTVLLPSLPRLDPGRKLLVFRLHDGVKGDSLVKNPTDSVFNVFIGRKSFKFQKAGTLKRKGGPPRTVCEVRTEGNVPHSTTAVLNLYYRKWKGPTSPSLNSPVRGRIGNFQGTTGTSGPKFRVETGKEGLLTPVKCIKCNVTTRRYRRGHRTPNTIVTELPNHPCLLYYTFSGPRLVSSLLASRNPGDGFRVEVTFRVETESVCRS